MPCNFSIKLVSPTTCRLLPHYGYHSPYVAPWGGMPLLVSKDSASTDAQRTSGHPLPHYPITDTPKVVFSFPIGLYSQLFEPREIPIGQLVYKCASK